MGSQGELLTSLIYALLAISVLKLGMSEEPYLRTLCLQTRTGIVLSNNMLLLPKQAISNFEQPSICFV